MQANKKETRKIARTCPSSSVRRRDDEEKERLLWNVITKRNQKNLGKSIPQKPKRHHYWYLERKKQNKTNRQRSKQK